MAKHMAGHYHPILDHYLPPALTLVERLTLPFMRGTYLESTGGCGLRIVFRNDPPEEDDDGA